MKLNEVVKLYFDDETILTETPRGGGLAFEKVVAESLRRRGADIWQPPAGSDSGWPDIGATIKIADGTEVHLHIEAKANKKDTMGSLRSWIFDGKKFSVKETKQGEDVRVLLSVMNTSKEALKNARIILTSLKKVFGGKTISGGSLKVVPDKVKRFKMALRFLKDVKKKLPKGDPKSAGLAIARIKSGEIGKLIVGHYNNKFKARAGKNILLLAAGDELFIIPGRRVDAKIKKGVEEWLGVDSIPNLPKSSNGTLEVRISVRRILEKDGTPRDVEKQKPSRFDVFAELNWDGLRSKQGVKFLKAPEKKLADKGPALGTLGVDTDVPEDPKKAKPNS